MVKMSMFEIDKDSRRQHGSCSYLFISRGVSGSALACGPCKSCLNRGFESRVKLVSQCKKSQTTVSTTERYFMLSVACLEVE